VKSFDSANRYALHTKVKLFTHSQLEEYCNQSSKDFSAAIRDFVEEGLDRWQSSQPKSSGKDSDLFKAVKSAMSIRDRKAMLKVIATESPEKFKSLCEQYEIEPSSVFDDEKESPAKKRDLCRYFLIGVLSNGAVSSKKIKELCLNLGFSENQMHRTLREIATNEFNGVDYFWKSM